jgi:LemA protein
LHYNSLFAQKNAVGNSFGSIGAMLKKPYDLLPNLVETVKQYMNYERDTLTKV